MNTYGSEVGETRSNSEFQRWMRKWRLKEGSVLEGNASHQRQTEHSKFL